MMQIPGRAILSLVVGLGFGGGPLAVPGPPQQSREPPSAGEIGSAMPSFAERDLRQRPISSTDLQGKVVLIDFWATWCEPCKKEMPGYQGLADRYRKKGLIVVGFEVGEMAREEDLVEFAKKLGIRYPLVVATEEFQRTFGGIEGLPTTLIYDRQGILRKRIVGFEYTAAVEAYIKGLL